MKMQSAKLAGLLLACTSTIAMAQAPAPAPAPSPMAPAAPAAGADEAGNPFTVANIDPLKPFGDLTVDTATNPDALAAWELTLSETQVTELDQRCDVITEASDFPPEPKAFCDMWLTVRADEMGDPAAAAVPTPAPGGGAAVTQTPPPGTPAAPAP
jgi:hypothetical protein